MWNEYIKQDFYIFPCNADKTPATPRGFYDAKKDWESFPGALIGLPTGNMNKIVVIDIDIKDDRDAYTLIDELKTYGPVPDTFTVQTPSGGLHLYYKIETTQLKSNARFFSKELPIDIRAEGGYVIGPDDNRYIIQDDTCDDMLTKCAPLPAWIENYKKPADIRGQVENKSLLPESEIKEIRSALNYIDADDRDTWVRIGMALKSTGDISGRGLWDEWSQKSDKFDPVDQSKKWDSFKPSDITIASIFHIAKSNGWETTYKIVENTKILSSEEIKKKFKQPSFPTELLNPPGLTGEIVDYINKKSIKEQPVLALGAALAAMGTLLGRKIQTETKIRTNIYCLGVGASGCGKDSARQAVKEIFHYAGCGEMASVEDIASDSGIVTAMELVPAQLFLLDEIGRFFRTTNNDNVPAHLYNIISVLLKFYSSAATHFRGKIYADARMQKQIDNPHLCIYGTTVPDVLYKNLSIENITDGFLSRMLVFESENPDPDKQRKNLVFTPPQGMINDIKKIRQKPINTNADNMLAVNPPVIRVTQKAEKILDDFENKIREKRKVLRNENRVDSIFNRTAQQAEQLALIIAGGVNIDAPYISEIEMTYGCDLALFLSEKMLYIAENFIADNDYEHLTKKVLKIIRDSGKISMSQLTRKTQNMPGVTRKDIIETLKDSEQIIEVLDEGKGKKKIRCFLPI